MNDDYESRLRELTACTLEARSEAVALRAELAAANARCTELERDVKNVTRWAMTREAERDALQARLDRVAALADELRNQLDAASAGLHARQSELEEVQRNLRAAEDRIERWKDVARASFTDRDSIPGDPQGGWRWKWRIPKMEPDFRVRISRLADNLSGFIPSDALGSPEERAAAAATSKHWERTLRAVLWHRRGKP